MSIQMPDIVPSAAAQFGAAARFGAADVCVNDIHSKLNHTRVDRVVAILDTQLAVEPTASGFYEPFTRFPAADRHRDAGRHSDF